MNPSVLASYCSILRLFPFFFLFFFIVLTSGHNSTRLRELVHKQPILSRTGPQEVKVVSSSFFFVHASPVRAAIVGGKVV